MMTVTLDGKTLDAKKFGESFVVVHSQSDAWQNNKYKRKVKVWGIVRVWTLDVVESSVVWASSQAKSFQDTGEAGTTVTFTVTDEVRVISTSVYILDMAIQIADLAGKNIRYFTVTLQEA